MTGTWGVRRSEERGSVENWWCAHCPPRRRPHLGHLWVLWRQSLSVDPQRRGPRREKKGFFSDSFRVSSLSPLSPTSFFLSPTSLLPDYDLLPSTICPTPTPHLSFCALFHFSWTSYVLRTLSGAFFHFHQELLCSKRSSGHETAPQLCSPRPNSHSKFLLPIPRIAMKNPCRERSWMSSPRPWGRLRARKVQTWGTDSVVIGDTQSRSPNFFQEFPGNFKSRELPRIRGFEIQ